MIKITEIYLIEDNKLKNVESILCGNKKWRKTQCWIKIAGTSTKKETKKRYETIRDELNYSRICQNLQRNQKTDEKEITRI